jgi:hypothetical protein
VKKAHKYSIPSPTQVLGSAALYCQRHGNLVEARRVAALTPKVTPPAALGGASSSTVVPSGGTPDAASTAIAADEKGTLRWPRWMRSLVRRFAQRRESPRAAAAAEAVSRDATLAGAAAAEAAREQQPK